MSDSTPQAMHGIEAANEAAKRVVRHFQSKGFTRITEALILQIHHIAGERGEIDDAFETAQEQNKIPPLSRYFAIHPYGHYSEFRDFDAAKAAIGNDFTLTLISDLPRVFFDPAPVMVDDPLASGTKYDVMMKVRDSVDGYAVAILLNDPDASFIDYVGTHPGADWHKIMGDFEVATTALVDEFKLS